ncbi:MAG: zinc ABC transporter substrate-binding protein [Pseudomonadota bacterium]
MAIAAIAWLTPSARADDTAASGKVNVVATTGMIADAVKLVGGEHVTVKALMGSGIDPHSYRQTRSDIRAMARADLVLWHGLYLEAQMQDFITDLGKHRSVIAVAEALPKTELLSHDTYADKQDPHVWMDPALWSTVVETVREALIETAPDHADDFRANAAAHLQEMETMADKIASALATVPKENRVLLTAHDAFAYFGKAYDFEVIGIQGISTESEAGLQRIRELVDMLVTRKIGAVFVETSVSNRNIKALIEGAASRGHTVNIGGELFSDAMGQPGSYEGTYIGMIDHNATTITRALGGEAPERGLEGRLTMGS